jgi:hypothetical protein
LDLRTATCKASSQQSDAWGCRKAFDQNITIGQHEARTNVTFCRQQ